MFDKVIAELVPELSLNLIEAEPSYDLEELTLAQSEPPSCQPSKPVSKKP